MRKGHDYRHNDGHVFTCVYSEMLLQIARDYAGLPDVRTLKASEIKFFYDAQRHELKELTKPKDNK